MTFQTNLRCSLASFFTLLSFVFIYAQAPQIINYQAVVRDAAGEIVKNKVVNFRLSVLDGGATGTPQYVETQSKTTNQFGLVTFGIGQGTTVSGSMSAVTWSTSNKFLKVELDINGGNIFLLMSTSQLLSVPFALYANTAGNGGASSSQWQNNNVGIHYNAGNVGIGTATPPTKLTVETNADGFGEVDGRTVIDIKNTSTSSASVVALRATCGSSGTFTSFSHHSSTYTAVNDAADMGQIWNTGVGLILRASPASASQDYLGSIRFYTGWKQAAFASNERMRIEANGNIGIGTTTPKTKLEIASGDVYLNDATKGIILKSPNGNCWRVTVDNTGNLVRTQITCP
jgi:hypothetical protein